MKVKNVTTDPFLPLPAVRPLYDFSAFNLGRWSSERWSPLHKTTPTPRWNSWSKKELSALPALNKVVTSAFSINLDLPHSP